MTKTANNNGAKQVEPQKRAAGNAAAPTQSATGGKVAAKSAAKSATKKGKTPVPANAADSSPAPAPARAKAKAGAKQPVAAKSRSRSAAPSARRRSKRQTTQTNKPALPGGAMPAAAPAGGSADISSINSVGVTFTPYQPSADEPYMGEGQREHFSGILHAWRTRLVKKFEGIVAHMQDDTSALPDPADRASQEEGFSMDMYTHTRESKLLDKIDQTLDKITNSQYGYCEECGIEIGLRRLEARPTATLCIDCKQVAEIKEQHLHVG